MDYAIAKGGDLIADAFELSAKLVTTAITNGYANNRIDEMLNMCEQKQNRIRLLVKAAFEIFNNGTNEQWDHILSRLNAGPEKTSRFALSLANNMVKKETRSHRIHKLLDAVSPEYVNNPRKELWEILMYAIRKNDFVLLHKSMVLGANINYSEIPRVPIHEAVLHFKREMLLCLIKRRADVNACESDGRRDSACHIAVNKGNSEALTILLDNGANPEIQNFNHRKPLEIAIKRCFPDGVKAILDHGVDPNASLREDKALTPLEFALKKVSLHESIFDVRY